MPNLLKSPYPDTPPAPAGIVHLGTVTSQILATTASQTLTLPGGTNLPVGTFVHVGIAYFTGVARVVTSFANSKGNTWAIANAAAATRRCEHITAVLTTALIAGDTLTIVYSGIPGQRLIWQVDAFSGVSPHTVDTEITGTAASGTAVSSGSTATTAQADELLIGGALILPGTTPAVAGDFTITPALGYTALPFVGTSESGNNVGFWQGYRIVSATGAYSYGGTQSASRAWRASLGTYRKAP